ncbi:tRNA(Glu)-specific nuclease WapA [Streptomyces hundungensis]|uniref:tRNA(Glu)-specific nuclease WapA n=1 Tax=Streptomyces hundungensis TaxID=1077946 RepID=A0A387H4F7_9ACTN|nr:tRNA(Glu)-specific nuclease WapA [Streptomyces hundungensis]
MIGTGAGRALVGDAQQVVGDVAGAGEVAVLEPRLGPVRGAALKDHYARTGESYTDHSQLASITVGGKAYAGQYGSTDQSERIRLGDTFFHNGPLGLSAKTTAGVDMGFNREPGGTLNSMTTGGKTYFYLTDAIGSVVALADIDGNKVDAYAYSPRGVRILAQSTEPVAQPYRFAGNYQDATGLYHLQARYYDANLGRFTQPDPSGKEKNPYLYAEGDPVNRIDPNGTSALSVVDGVVGKIGDAKSLYDVGKDLVSGDVVGAARGSASLAAGVVVGGICEAATGPESGFLSTAGCYAAGELTSQGVETWLS